jgi:hypothetical protein
MPPAVLVSDILIVNGGRDRARASSVELLVTDARLMFAGADVLAEGLGTWSRELGGSRH